MMCSCSSGILVKQRMDIVNTTNKKNKILKYNVITLCKEMSASNHEFHHITNVLKPNKYKPDHS